MYHHRKGIYRVSCDTDIELHDIVCLVTEWFIVETRISTRETLEIIIEIPYQFTHRDFIMEDDTFGIEIGLIFKHPPSFLGEAHKIPDIFIGRNHLDFRNGLFDMDIGTWIWEILGIRYPEIGTFATFELYELRISSRIVGTLISSDEDLIGHLRARDDYIHIMFSPETLLHDIEMEESEKSTAKSISECW
jgi:hypothetical protein